MPASGNLAKRNATDPAAARVGPDARADTRGRDDGSGAP